MKEIKEPDWKNFFDPGIHPGSLSSLSMWFAANIKGKLVIDPDDVVEVKGYDDRGKGGYIYFDSSGKGMDHSHKALLIKSSIEPIEKDSFERLVKDLNTELKKWSFDEETEPMWHIASRAKRLLEGEL